MKFLTETILVGLGALVATHNHELAASMSRVARLEQGRIIGG